MNGKATSKDTQTSRRSPVTAPRQRFKPSTLPDLPAEVLHLIFSFVERDLPCFGSNGNLFSLLFVSKPWNAVAHRVLYGELLLRWCPSVVWRLEERLSEEPGLFGKVTSLSAEMVGEEWHLPCVNREHHYSNDSHDEWGGSRPNSVTNISSENWNDYQYRDPDDFEWDDDNSFCTKGSDTLWEMVLRMKVLRSLSLTNFPPPYLKTLGRFSPLEPRIFPSTIRKFDLDIKNWGSPCVPALQELLHSLPHLTSFTFWGEWGHLALPGPGQPLFASHLAPSVKDLSINTESWVPLEKLGLELLPSLIRVTVPRTTNYVGVKQTLFSRLTALTITPGLGDQDNLLHAMSCSSLQHLTLNDSPWPTPATVDSLPKSLKTLSIGLHRILSFSSVPTINSITVEQLIVAPATFKSTLPRLSHLAVRVWDPKYTRSQLDEIQDRALSPRTLGAELMTTVGEMVYWLGRTGISDADTLMELNSERDRFLNEDLCPYPEWS
ncbi:hypothetical protein T439DRAFT_20090 [Meredithblackwellia eburnea MCA 4105]